MIRISSLQMQDVLYKLFLKHDFTEEKAKTLAQIYTENTLAGVNSHGINRVPLFIEYVEKSIVKVDAEAEKVETFGSIERWDGNLGPLYEVSRLRTHCYFPLTLTVPSG